MNYADHYNKLIDRARNRKMNGYTEAHHIIPRCLGGTDDSDNIVRLTPEEHYVAHQLLVKIYPDNYSLVFAANKMTVASRYNNRSNNKRYGWLKKKYSEACRKTRFGKNNPSYGKKWYHCPNTLDSGKFSKDEIPDGWERGRVPKILIRNCKRCGVKVDEVIRSNSIKRHIVCSSCSRPNKYDTRIHDYETISKVYLDHKKTGVGYCTLAERYGINKWTIYDYIKRYKNQLIKDFGV